MYIIEKSDGFAKFILSNKEYNTFSDKKKTFKDSKYYDVKLVEYLNTKVRLIAIEDKNENFIKYISYSLKQEKKRKNNVEAKRRLVLVLSNKAFEEIKFNYFTKTKRKFHSNISKHVKVHLPLLRPPDYLKIT